MPDFIFKFSIKPCFLNIRIINVLFALLWLVFMEPVFAIDLTPEIESNLGPKACVTCHIASTRAWKKTQHYKTYKEIPRKRVAKKRAKKMRFKHIKTDSLCVNCHFTAVKAGSRIKTVAGISCESCHGGSRKWLDIHSDFGGRGVKANEETPEHKVQRHYLTEAAGMLQLSNIYDMAKNCYRCHTVPEEKLVNIGRHPAGSDFELVKWGQGENRHNLWYHETVNNPLPKQRLRIMFVVGKALDLEYALRGLALASSEGEYFAKMVSRKSKALAGLKAIINVVPITEIQKIIELTERLTFNIKNSDYLPVAKKIAEINRVFSIYADGNQLQNIDALLPPPESYIGEVYQP